MANMHPQKGPNPFSGSSSRKEPPPSHPLLPGKDRYGCTFDKDDMVMSFRIPADVLKRLQLRAGWVFNGKELIKMGTPIDQYVYENIVHRAVTDYVY